MTTSDFIDDQAKVNARITEHELRLGLPKSEPTDDIARANLILRGLELVPTPANPAAPAAQPTPATTTATGTQRVAKAYTANQPAPRSGDAALSFPRDGKLHGVALLAAHYARHQSSTTPAA